MSPLKYWTTVICTLFIAIGDASNQEVKVYGEVGGTVSFGVTSLNPPVSSIIWKHRNSTGYVVKAIEWDVEDGVSAPNQRFQGITTLDKITGEINITKLNVNHSGLFTIDINSKEQEQRFKLKVLALLPKPKIEKKEIEINPNAIKLICEYSEPITWKNSTGGTLQGSPHSPKGELIKVEKQGNPDFFYTCTLENPLRNSTSDPVYERDLFKDEQTDGGGAKTNGKELEEEEAKRNEGGPSWIVPTVIILILILALIIVFVVLYKVWETFHKIVHDNFKDTPCIGAILNLLDGKNKDYSLPPQLVLTAETNVNGDPQPGGEPNDAQPGGEPNGEEEKQEDDKQSQHLKENGEDETEKGINLRL